MKENNKDESYNCLRDFSNEPEQLRIKFKDFFYLLTKEYEGLYHKTNVPKKQIKTYKTMNYYLALILDYEASEDNARLNIPERYLKLVKAEDRHSAYQKILIHYPEPRYKVVIESPIE